MAATLPNNCYGIWKGAKGRNQISVLRYLCKMPHKWLEFLEVFEIIVPRIWGVEPLSSEKCWCLCGLYSQVSIFCAWGPENWNRSCGLAGWWWVRVTGRGEGRQSQAPCVRGLQLFTGYGHGTLTDPFHCSDFRHSFTLFIQGSLLCERRLVYAV